MRRRREQAISRPLLLFSSVIYHSECFLQWDPEGERVDELILILSHKVEAGGLGSSHPTKGFVIHTNCSLLLQLLFEQFARIKFFFLVKLFVLVWFLDNRYGFPWFLKFAFTCHPHIARSTGWSCFYLIQSSAAVQNHQLGARSKMQKQHHKLPLNTVTVKNSTLLEVRNFLCKFPLYIYFFLWSKITSAFKMQAQREANPVILVCQCSAHTWIISNGWAWWRVQGVSGSTTHHRWRPWKLKTGWKAWFKYTPVRVSEKQPESRESHNQPQ